MNNKYLFQINRQTFYVRLKISMLYILLALTTTTKYLIYKVQSFLKIHTQVDLLKSVGLKKHTQMRISTQKIIILIIPFNFVQWLVRQSGLLAAISLPFVCFYCFAKKNVIVIVLLFENDGWLIIIVTNDKRKMIMKSFAVNCNT